MAKGNKVLARSAISAAVAAVVLSIGSSAAQAQSYTVTDIGSQIAGNGHGAVPASINNSDQVVGYYNSTANYGAELPFAYTPGSGAVTIPNISPYFQTGATAINNSGMVVGTGIVTGSSTTFAQGFVYNANTGAFTAVAPLAVENSSYEPNLVLTGINNSGLAVGYSFTNANSTSYRAVTYNVSSGGTPTDIGSNFSGPVQSGAGVGNSNEALGVSDSGVIAGVGPNFATSGANSTTGDYYIATPTSSGTYPAANFVDITQAISNASGGQYSGVDFTNLYFDAAGNIAGTFKNTQSSHSYDGFLYTAKTGTAVLIDSGVNQTQVEGLADIGGKPEVVGYTSVYGNSQAFIYSNGTFSDVYSTLAPGYDVLSIDAINSKGDLAVVATPTSGGTADAYLLTLPAVVMDYYFTGATNSSWATVPNFATTHTGTTAQGAIASGANVFLTADAASNAASQTLDGSYTLNSLTFTGTSTAGAGLAINLSAGSGGTLTINGANAFTATTAAGSTNYAAGIGMVVQSGSGGDTISAPIVLGSSQSWEVDSGGTLSVTGGVSDGGAGLALTKTGSGLLVLGGTNTYSGGTSVQAGTLDVTGAIAGSGTISVSASSNPAALILDGANAVASSVAITAGAGSFTPTVTVNSNQNFASLTNAGASNFNAGSTTIGTVANTGTTTIGSTATLNATSAFSETLVSNAGTLNINGGTADSIGSLANNGVTQFNGAGTISQLSGTGTLKIGTTSSTNTVALATQSTPNSFTHTQDAVVIAPGSTLDITNNTINIDYGSGASPLAAVANAVAYGAGVSTATNANGSIISSTANAGPSGQYTVGYADATEDNPTTGLAVPSGNVAVRYTLAGDATLQGTVNYTDYSILEANYLKPGDWSQGDFNHDGVVNFTDYSILESNYLKTVNAASPLVLGSTKMLKFPGSSSAAALSVAVAGASPAIAGGVSPAISSNPVTFTLSINDNGSGQYAAGKFAVYASDVIASGNTGILSYGFYLQNLTSSGPNKGTIKLVGPAGYYDDGTGQETDDEIGFTASKLSSVTGGVNSEGQDIIVYNGGTGPVIPVYGFGQTAGNLANDEAPGSTGPDLSEGTPTQPVYGAPLEIATGTFAGLAPAFNLSDQNIANILEDNSDMANEVVGVNLDVQTLSAPEPGSLALLGLGGLALGRRRRRSVSAPA